jgi:hypothetical protein
MSLNPSVMSRFQRSKTVRVTLPGALPLAITFQAFGLKNIRYRTASGSERDKDSTFLMRCEERFFQESYERCVLVPLATARGSVTSPVGLIVRPSRYRSRS